MAELQPLPPERGFLNAFVLRARRRTLQSTQGGHITRRLGQSLEFSEYQRYYPGTDIRHVDWRASLRMPRYAHQQEPDRWMTRRFQAEETLKVLISIDARPTMQGPEKRPALGQRLRRNWRLLRGGAAAPDEENISKLQFAWWLAEALADVVLSRNDEVTLHSLFKPQRGGGSIQRLRGSASVGQLQATVAQAGHPLDEAGASFNDTQLMQYLPPAAIWVILTDFYFEGTARNTFVSYVQRAQSAFRWIILIDLDSWLWERSLLQEGAWLVTPTGRKTADGKKLVTDAEYLNAVEHKIAGHKQAIFQACGGKQDISPDWQLPPGLGSDDKAFRAFTIFQDRFMKDRLLSRIFERQA